MKRGADRPAKARSLILADHAARCACEGRAPCPDGDELRRVLMRQVDAQIEAAGAGLDELARRQVDAALRPALEGLAVFNHALRTALDKRASSPSSRAAEPQSSRTTTTNNNTENKNAPKRRRAPARGPSR